MTSLAFGFDGLLYENVLVFPLSASLYKHFHLLHTLIFGHGETFHSSFTQTQKRPQLAASQSLNRVPVTSRDAEGVTR